MKKDISEELIKFSVWKLPKMVIPVICEKDFQKIREKVALVDKMVDLLQIDVADGILVDGLTYLDIHNFDTLETQANLEIHLMVKNPLEFLKERIQKATKIISQVEADNVEEFINRAKELGYIVGLSIETKTPPEKIEPYVNKVDYIQFVSVEPGGQGRKFETEVLDKIKNFRKRHPDIPIQVDGGINNDNISDVLKAGANDVVIGSAIFNMKESAQSKNPIIGASRNAIVSSDSPKKIKRIAFLGGAGWNPEDQVFKDAYEVAKLLATEGYSIINGGGPGVMRAATLGAHDAGKRALAVTYHPNKPKRHYEGVDTLNNFDEEIITLDYFDRTKVMLQTTDLHIIFKGSIGTLSELGMSWISSWIHEPDNKPIILFGEFWEEFIELFRKHFLLTRNEEHVLKICRNSQEVLDYINSLG